MNISHVASVRSRGALALSAIVFLVACGGTATQPSPTALSVRSVTVVLVAGSTAYQGSAVAAFSDGSSREVTSEAQWTVSDPSVAAVTPAGQVTVLKAGSTDVRATYRAVVGSAALTVASPPPPPAPLTYTVSGSIVDALDGRTGDLEDGDICCSFRIVTATGTRTPVTQITRSAGSVRHSVTIMPADIELSIRATGHAEQTRNLSATSNETVDFALPPLPFRLYGGVNFRNYGPPKCGALLEILDGPNAGRSATVKAGQSTYEFSGLIQPDTPTMRMTAPGGYPTQVFRARLRGDFPWGLDVAGQRFFLFDCPLCPSPGVITRCV